MLTEVWRAGYPVVAFDFGAVAERMRVSGGGLLLTPTRDADALVDALTGADAELAGFLGGRAVSGFGGTLETYYRPPALSELEGEGRPDELAQARAEQPDLLPVFSSGLSERFPAL